MTLALCDRKKCLHCVGTKNRALVHVVEMSVNLIGEHCVFVCVCVELFIRGIVCIVHIFRFATHYLSKTGPPNQKSKKRALSRSRYKNHSKYASNSVLTGSGIAPLTWECSRNGTCLAWRLGTIICQYHDCILP